MRLNHLIIITFLLSGMSHAKNTGLQCEKSYADKREIKSSLQSKVFLITNKDDIKVIVKQRKDTSAHDQMITVLDTLGALIAESLNLRSNYVSLIPADRCERWKFFLRVPATLHSFMRGVKTRMTERFKNLMVLQRTRNVNQEMKGLTLDVIKNMALHDDLPQLVAVDTYIGNTDRNRFNILYDEETDHLNAIDFGDSFATNLSALAVTRVEKLKAQKILLTAKELGALAVYTQTLEILLQHFPSKVLKKKFNLLVYQAGLTKKQSKRYYNKEELDEEILIHKEFFRRSYESTKQLVHQLREFIAQCSKMQADSMLVPAQPLPAPPNITATQ